MAKGRKRTTLRLHDTPEKNEQGNNMPKEEITAPESAEKKEVSSQVVEPLNINESPMMEAMIERTGGDDFLYKDKQPTSQTVEPNPIDQNGSAVNNQPPANGSNSTPAPQGGPKEFVFDPITQVPDPVPGATEPGGGAGDAPTNPIPEAITSESSKMMADLILNVAGMGVPIVSDRYSRFNEDKLRELEQQNKIQPGLLEIAKDINKNNKNAVKLTSDHKQLIREPLVKFLEIKGVKASPEAMLAIACLTVLAMLVFQSYSIKSTNDETLRRWEDDHSEALKLRKENELLRKEKREREEQGGSKEIVEAPYASVENV